MKNDLLQFLVVREMECALKEVVVIPVASESLGVRSMCTYIETPDVKILLDAGVSLGPIRFGLPPHPREYKALKNRREEIVRFAEKSEVITVSHYHFDHHTPSFTDWAYNWCSAEIAERIYKGKIILAKNYKDYVNFSQRRRGWIFAKTCGEYAERFEIADNRVFTFGSTSISFSKPVFHGPEGSDLGWVVMSVIRHRGESILFAPDVQGPISQETLSIILDEKPQVAIIGGPPIYLADFKMNHTIIDLALENLKIIAKHVPALILDHHILRDESWEDFMKIISEAAESVGHRVLTSAEFSGKGNYLLEAFRKKLYEIEPPSEDFIKWSKKPSAKRKTIPPPI